LEQNYTFKLVTGDRRDGSSADVVVAGTAEASFTKPMDNIGNKTFPNYDGYADRFVYDIDIPSCDTPGGLFIGQRKAPFVVNLQGSTDLMKFLALGSGVSYDPATKEITAPSLGIDRGFYRLKTNEEGISLQIGEVTDETVKVRVVLNQNE
jgi:hypothetical protein